MGQHPKQSASQLLLRRPTSIRRLGSRSRIDRFVLCLPVVLVSVSENSFLELTR